MAWLAIADPPYLGRGRRWYSDAAPPSRRGRHGKGGGTHPDAHIWDDPQTHLDLMDRLESDFDGYAVACSTDSLTHYARLLGTGARLLIWHKPNAIPSGSRIKTTLEVVLVRPPAGRTAHHTGPKCSDLLTCVTPRTGFAGAKPDQWTNWVLDALAYDPNSDEITDLFPGSGAVTDIINERTAGN